MDILQIVKTTKVHGPLVLKKAKNIVKTPEFRNCLLIQASKYYLNVALEPQSKILLCVNCASRLQTATTVVKNRKKIWQRFHPPFTSIKRKIKNRIASIKQSKSDRER